MVRLRVLIAGCIFWAIFGSSNFVGQSTFGSIVGTIQDKSGSLIPNATVSLTNLDENITREALSNPQGSYEFLNLLPGRYSVVGEKTGFTKVRIPELRLDSRQERRVDLTLEIAAVTETVEVQAQAAQLNTENATLSDTKDFRLVTELPVNYRGGSTSPLAAIVALPGVQQDASGNISVGGGVTTQGTDYNLDGVSNQAIRNNGAFANMYPSSEMLSEFKVSAVSNSAEFGSVGDVLITTKSGANRVHGSAFDYLQNRALDATTYGSLAKQAKVWNTFGGSLSGPVYIPKLYNGRNKTFFFVDYEGNRRPGSQLQQDTVPTSAMRAGSLNGVPGGPAVDPTDGRPFPNNSVPVARLNVTALKVLNTYYPSPNASNAAGGVFNNYVIQTPVLNHTDGYDFRIDQSFGVKQQVFGRFSSKSIPQTVPDVFLPNQTSTEGDKSLVVSDNYTIRPTLLNEFRFGFSRYINKQIFPVTGQNAVDSLGLIGINAASHPGDGGFPGFDFSDGTGFSCVGLANFMTSGAVTSNRCGSAKVAPQTSGTYNFSDTVSWIRGKHTMRFGFDLRHVYYTEPTTFTAGADDWGYFTFSQGAFTGNAYADFLLGLPFSSQIEQTGPDLSQKANHYAFFAQDEFRVSNRLTLTVGLRYELVPPYSEANGNLTTMSPGSNSWTASTANDPIVVPDKTPPPLPGFLFGINACPGGRYGPSAPYTTTLPCTPVITASSIGLPQDLRYTYWYDIDPRFSVAWRPFGNNTVFRAGVGKFTVTNQGTFANIDASLHTSDARSFQNYFPGQPALFTLPVASSGTFDPASVGLENLLSAVDTRIIDPQSIQFNVTVEHEFGKGYAARVSYIGMNTYGLTTQINLNQVHASTTPYNKLNTPFPNWGPSVLSNAAQGFGNYQALETQLNHRFASGFSLQATYDFAKNLANLADRPGTIIGDYGQSTLENRFNQRYSRGNTSGTRRNRFLFSGLYELPFGRGKAFLSHSNALINGALGGWQVSTITLLQSGPYATVTVARSKGQANTALGGGGGNRPDLIGNPNIASGSSIWNASAFALVPTGAGRYGSEGVGVVEGPGTIAVAAGLSKYFSLLEKARIRFEATFTNALNHPNFAQPATVLTTPSTFGVLTTVQSAENSGNRVGQLSLRLEF
jgi:hypothetical protein